MSYKSLNYQPEYMNIYESDVFGGKQLNINLNPSLTSDLLWLNSYRKKVELEEKLRQENPALNSAYEQYQTILNLLLDVK